MSKPKPKVVEATMAAIRAESVRGRRGVPPRAHVIVGTASGFAVYNAATGKRESKFFRSARGKILDAWGAIDAGLILTLD